MGLFPCPLLYTLHTLCPFSVGLLILSVSITTSSLFTRSYLIFEFEMYCKYFFPSPSFLTSSPGFPSSRSVALLQDSTLTPFRVALSILSQRAPSHQDISTHPTVSSSGEGFVMYYFLYSQHQTQWLSHVRHLIC